MDKTYDEGPDTNAIKNILRNLGAKCVDSLSTGMREPGMNVFSVDSPSVAVTDNYTYHQSVMGVSRYVVIGPREEVDKFDRLVRDERVRSAARLAEREVENNLRSHLTVWQYRGPKLS